MIISILIIYYFLLKLCDFIFFRKIFLLRKAFIKKGNKMQLSFFQLNDPILENSSKEILTINIDTLTPIKAFMKLNEIKRILEKK